MHDDPPAAADPPAEAAARRPPSGPTLAAPSTLPGAMSDSAASDSDADHPTGGLREPAAALDLGTGRYAVLERLGEGGQGAVYRVYDHKMQRPLAMKVLKTRASPAAQARFRTETALTVGLEHPGIVPIYDRGTTADGRPWYTMQILEGADFGAQIRRSDVPLRRRLDLFVRACEAVAYAHREGVLHRDLKPQNIMVGAFGDVRVLDWGLARRSKDRPHRSHSAADSNEPPPDDPFATRAGAVMGTPRYMAPEQLAGDLDALGPASDVYALGLMLGELISGAPPGGRSLAEIGQLRRVDLPGPATGPQPLRALCARATRHDPAERPVDAGALAAEIRRWLEDAERRAQSAALVDEAASIEPQIAVLRAEADALDTQAAQILDPLPPHAPIERRRSGWQHADQAVAKRRAARLAEVRLRQTLQSALRLDPDSAPAKAALTAHYRSRLLEAEATHDSDRAAEFEALLLGHDRAANTEWLRGDGKATLFTDPPGATVDIYRYESRDRRLIEVHQRTIRKTPLVELPLAMGSYLLKINHPGRAEVRYPVNITRHGFWDGIPPGEAAPHAIPLPAADATAEHESYVPAGWCVLGGDADAPDGLPAQRIWVDGFVIDRDPVTHGSYIEWLDALVADGREAEACAHQPTHVTQGSLRRPAYARDDAGRFGVTSAFGYQPALDWPVVGISVESARAFAAWCSVGGGPARALPSSWQWEKAARGVDGRAFPWGDDFEVAWANVLNHRAGPPTPCAVGGLGADLSPYGVRGLAGNVRDPCGDAYERSGPTVGRGRVVGRAPTDADFTVVKGGVYFGSGRTARSAARFGLPLGETSPIVGLRLCRPLS